MEIKSVVGAGEFIVNRAPIICWHGWHGWHGCTYELGTIFSK